MSFYNGFLPKDHILGEKIFYSLYAFHAISSQEMHRETNAAYKTAVNKLNGNGLFYEIALLSASAFKRMRFLHVLCANLPRTVLIFRKAKENHTQKTGGFLACLCYNRVVFRQR